VEITKEFLEGCIQVNAQDLQQKLLEVAQLRGVINYLGDMIEYVEKEPEEIPSPAVPPDDGLPIVDLEDITLEGASDATP